MSEQKPGIYCIEGVPDPAEGEISARPTLEMLSQAHGFRFVCRTAATKQEFEHHFMKWVNMERKMRSKKFPILYLWYHGYPEGISLNLEDAPHKTSIRFDDIADALEYTFNLENCIIHFGSCSTLASEDSKVLSFLNENRLTAISGYTKDVGWIDGAAMELLYLNCLYDIFREDNRKRYLKQEILRKCRDRLKAKSPSKEIAGALGFDIKVRRSK